MALIQIHAEADLRDVKRADARDPAGYLEAEGVTARVEGVYVGAPVVTAAAPRADRPRILARRAERAARRAVRGF